jgi:excisionase family DNA binding protein
MTKEQAARFLGVTVRSLQRHTQAGRLSVKYERNRRGTMSAIYDRAELKAFKQQLQQPVNKPALAGADSTALAWIPQAEDFPQRLLEALEAFRSKPSSPPPVSLSEKLTLSLSEASQLSGLSRQMLAGYIKAKKLKAQILGRGWRIKRADLEAFIKVL